MLIRLEAKDWVPEVSDFRCQRIKRKSLILAQIERWRHALHMQVERARGACFSS